jgi:ankyrin repeat protein
MSYKNKYLKYKQKYLQLKNQNGGICPENCDCILGKSIIKKTYINCDDDTTLQNLHGTCWALSILMIFIFGDSTRECTQTTLMTKHINHIITDSDDILKLFLPSSFYADDKLLPEKILNMRILINYLIKKINVKKNNLDLHSNKDIHEIEFVQAFNNLFNLKKKIPNPLSSYVTLDFFLINLLSCLFIQKLININIYSKQHLENNIGILILSVDHCTSFYKCNHISKFCNDDYIIDYDYFAFFNKIDEYSTPLEYKLYLSMRGPCIYDILNKLIFYFDIIEQLTDLNPIITYSEIIEFKFLTINNIEDNITFRDNNYIYYLYYAIRHDDIELLKYVLDMGINLNINLFDDGYTPLYLASKHGYEHIVKLLLDYGALTNFKTEQDDTALSVSIQHGHNEIVKILLEFGSNPNLKGSNDTTPLYWAIKKNNNEIVQLLLEHKAEPNLKGYNGTPLYWAIKKNNNEIVKLLLDHGADPNLKGFNGTPLYWAIVKNNNDIVKLLLEHSADPDLTTNEYTPLYIASHENFIGIVQLLLEHGANPDLTSNGNTPLYIASQNNFTEIVQLLLEHKVNPD